MRDAPRTIAALGLGNDRERTCLPVRQRLHGIVPRVLEADGGALEAGGPLHRALWEDDGAEAGVALVDTDTDTAAAV